MIAMRSRYYVVQLIAVLAGSLIVCGPDSAALAQVALPAPLDNTLDRRLDGRILTEMDRELESRIERPLEDDVQSTVEPLTDPVTQAAPDNVLDTAGNVVDETKAALPAVVQSVADAAGKPLRTFVEDVDPYGWPVEKDVLIMLVEPGELAEIEQSGLPVVQQKKLASLGLVLVRIEGPPGPSLAEAALDIRSRFPKSAVDYNYLYRPAGEQGATDDATAAPLEDASSGKSQESGIRIGLIDSAVSTDHPALAGARVTLRDFVPYEGTRPLGHGTAVASIMAASTPDKLEILAASVFFQKPGFAPGASTESLLAALDWLASEQVDAINMSLAGPADELLERAVAQLRGNGPPIVAAVGNNGPAGEPLYPAAYESVLGVTAIDREQRIFAYANRGDHVAFAALGVNVKVANSGGGFRIESGTSMASPYVAAVIGSALHSSELPKDSLIELLKANAEDLGDEGFDPVFGYGLITPPPDQNAAARLTE